jgi:single-stranded DNA-binding protein
MNTSAPAIDEVISIANLTADPAFKQLDDERSVCQRRLAVNNPTRRLLFTDIVAVAAQDRACTRYRRIRRAVAVAGRLVVRDWDDHSGCGSRHRRRARRLARPRSIGREALR